MHQLTNTIGIDLRLIPAGEFMMGSPDSDEYAFPNETPHHLTRITKPFLLGVTEVTQKQYEEIMGANPSVFDHDQGLPVEKVSWEEAVAFCQHLSKKEGKAYRLPTEAEWEYACRAGSTANWHFGDNEADLENYAWYSANSGDKTHPVAQKQPNAWGLYDMHGNVGEWCSDLYRVDYYATSPTDDPQGHNSGEYLAHRGNGWCDVPLSCRSAFRRWGTADFQRANLGFRLACSVE